MEFKHTLHTCQGTPVCQITGLRTAEMGFEVTPAVGSQVSHHWSGLRETTRRQNQRSHWWSSCSLGWTSEIIFVIKVSTWPSPRSKLYLPKQDCALTQMLACSRSRGSCARSLVWRDFCRAQRGKADPECEAAASCWSAQGGFPAPPASDWPVQAAGPGERSPHCPLFNKRKQSTTEFQNTYNTRIYGITVCGVLPHIKTSWLLWPVWFVAVLRTCKVVSKRWTRPSQAAIKSSLSDG